MSYTAEIYNVMLASPSDVNEEREVAREIILDWNNVNSLTRKIVLMPLGWEYNSVPTTGDRPQEIINKQVVENADLLVGIFWTRIGTPTGKAISGSVEEIERHINSGKPAMLYFSNKPVVPDSIDSAQYKAVKKLKTEYQSKSLTENFDSLEDFKSKFQRHLSLKINNDKYFQILTNEISDLNLADLKKTDLIETLSNEAKSLLIEASKDISGQIIKLTRGGGFSLQTNRKGFIEDFSPRTIALWEAVLEELEYSDLIKPLGIKGQIYQLTKKGYELADSLVTQNK